MAIWRFATQYGVHWYPPEPDDELHDVIKLFAVYGCGQCDDFATVTCEMFNLAGLRPRFCGVRSGETRTTRQFLPDGSERTGTAMLGHCTTEVAWDNAWHLLDANQRLFFPKHDSRKLASLADVQAAPALARRVPHPYYDGFWKVYMHGGGGVAEYSGRLDHRLTARLRPGERMDLRWDNRLGKYHDAHSQLRDKREHLGVGPSDMFTGEEVYTNGVIAFEPRLRTRKELEEATVARRNIHPIQSSATRGGFVMDRPGSAYAVFELRSPYLLVSGEVECRVMKRDPEAQIAFYFTKWDKLLTRSQGGSADDADEANLRLNDLRFWRRVSAESAPDGRMHAPLEPMFRTRHANGTVTEGMKAYRVFVRVQIQSERREAVVVEGLRLQGVLQAAQRSMPRLRLGHNVANVFCGGPLGKHAGWTRSRDGSGVKVFSRYENGLRVGYAFREVHVEIPEIGEPTVSVIDEGAMTVRWRCEGRGRAEAYEVQLGERPDALWPVAPQLFDRRTTEPRFEIPEGWLQPGQSYHVRVRAVVKDGHCGPWRRTSFRYR